MAPRKALTEVQPNAKAAESKNTESNEKEQKQSSDVWHDSSLDY